MKNQQRRGCGAPLYLRGGGGGTHPKDIVDLVIYRTKTWKPYDRSQNNSRNDPKLSI